MNRRCRILVLGFFLALIALGTGHGSAQKTFPPLGPLPPVPVPADNPMSPEKVELGKLLFFDGRLGGDLSSPCSRCHVPREG